MTMICTLEIWTEKVVLSIRVKPPVTIGGTGLTWAPCETCAKLPSTNDMPIAESIGARRKEWRSGR